MDPSYISENTLSLAPHQSSEEIYERMRTQLEMWEVEEQTYNTRMDESKTVSKGDAISREGKAKEKDVKAEKEAKRKSLRQTRDSVQEWLKNVEVAPSPSPDQTSTRTFVIEKPKPKTEHDRREKREKEKRKVAALSKVH